VRTRMLATKARAVNGKSGPHLRQHISRNGFERPVCQKISRQLRTKGIISGAARLIHPFDYPGREIKPRPFDAAAALVRPNPTGGHEVRLRYPLPIKAILLLNAV